VIRGFINIYLDRSVIRCNSGTGGDPLTGPPPSKSYWLEIVAVVPSNFVMWMVNGSL